MLGARNSGSPGKRGLRVQLGSAHLGSAHLKPTQLGSEHMGLVRASGLNTNAQEGTTGQTLGGSASDAALRVNYGAATSECACTLAGEPRTGRS